MGGRASLHDETPLLPGETHAGMGGPWKRFRKDRLAKSSLVLLTTLTAVSLLALPFAVQWYNVQDLETAVRHAPSFEPVTSFQQYAMPKSVCDKVDATPSRDREGAVGAVETGPLPYGRGSERTFQTRSKVSSRAVAMRDASSPATRLAYRASSWAGHDDLGRSLLFRLVPGFLVSLLVGLAAALFAVGLGTVWGAVAGMLGARVDLVMMRIVDVLFGLPYILMVILLKVALTRPLTTLLAGQSRYADLIILTLAIGGVSWLTPARVIRGQVLSLRAQPFIEAARAAGAGPVHILWRHLLPNLIGPMIVYATLVIPQAILQESFLSFLGIGVQQPVPSLGRLAADGVEAVNTFVGFWWLLVFPCGLLVVTLLAINFVGDGLRDAFDPTSSATMVT